MRIDAFPKFLAGIGALACIGITVAYIGRPEAQVGTVWVLGVLSVAFCWLFVELRRLGQTEQDPLDGEHDLYFPADPRKGDIYFEVSEGRAWRFDGLAWEEYFGFLYIPKTYTNETGTP